MTNRRLVFPALIAAGLLWGTTVPLSKIALGWLPPGWLVVGRFALAAVVLMIASRSRLRAACSPAILISGGIGYGATVLLENLGIERTSVTHAALLIGATPVLVALIAAVLRQSVARPLAWAGFALSLAGVGFIASGQGSGSTVGGDGLVLAAQLVSAAFTVSQAKLLRGRDPVAVTGLQLMAAAVLVLPIALATEHHAAGPVSAAAVLAAIGLVIGGTVGSTALFAYGQSRVAADVAGAFLNIEPLVGALLGVAMFADPLGPVQLAGGAAIVAGIGLSSFQVMGGERRGRISPAAGQSTATGATAVTPALTAVLRMAGEAPSLVRRTRLPGVRGSTTQLTRRLRPAGRALRRSATGRRPATGRRSATGPRSVTGRRSRPGRHGRRHRLRPRPQPAARARVGLSSRRQR